MAERAERMAAVRDARAADLAERVRAFVQPADDERALDVGTGVGAVAFALAPLVREVVAVDSAQELLDEARKAAPANVELVEADAARLPFEDGSFDLACAVRLMHHVRRPELVFAELTRVVRAGGRVFVADQIAPPDPLVALELDRFERARDPTHTRTLPDVDIRHFAEANNLVLRRSEMHRERRELDSYLDVAACEGDARADARALAPRSDSYLVEVGWYLWSKPSL